MNISRIIDYFSQKSWMWQRAYCNFYLLIHHLYGIKCKTEIEPAMLARCCQNVDDLEKMWELGEYLDSTEKEMTNLIGTYRFCRPIPWQYDFVEMIAEKSEINIRQTLNIDAIIDAYCIAIYSDNVQLSSVVQELDAQYAALYDSAARKQNLLKRNFSLILENLKPHCRISTADLNFRELVETFLPLCGYDAVVKALRQATTAEVKLTPEERAALGFAYYSPYFCDEVELQFGKIPGSNIFSCTEGRLQEECEYREYLKQERWKPHDEDEEDDITDALEEKHNAVFVDPQERCLIDTHYGEVLYANVYIERFPEDFLNNSLPDFIRCHKGRLYTIEFVDDIKKLDAAQELVERLNGINFKMLQLEREQLTSGKPDWSPDAREKYAELSAERVSCYYVCD